MNITYLIISAAIAFTSISIISLLGTILAYRDYKDSLQYRGDVDYYETELHYVGYQRALFLTLVLCIISINLWSL